MESRSLSPSYGEWFKAWMTTTRPKTLPIWIAPVFVGSLTTSLPLKQIHWNFIFWGICISVFLQLGVHCINDVIDVLRGADSEERLGPRRGVHSKILNPAQVYFTGLVCFVCVLLCGIPLHEKTGGFIFFILLLSVICGYCYTGGPWPLSYIGIADLFVLIFFGWISPLMTAYLQIGSIDYFPFLAGTQTGLLSIIPLLIGNLRDYEGDAKANKKTLIVRFGQTFGRLELVLISFIPYLMTFLWFPSQHIGAVFFPWVTFPIALYLVKNVWTHEPSAEYNRFLAIGAALPLLFGLTLIVGYHL